MGKNKDEQEEKYPSLVKTHHVQIRKLFPDWLKLIKVKEVGHLQFSNVIPKGTRSQGFEGSSEMLTNNKDLKVRLKSYKLCLEIKEYHRNPKNVKGGY